MSKKLIFASRIRANDEFIRRSDATRSTQTRTRSTTNTVSARDRTRTVPIPIAPRRTRLRITRTFFHRRSGTIAFTIDTFTLTRLFAAGARFRTSRPFRPFAPTSVCSILTRFQIRTRTRFVVRTGTRRPTDTRTFTRLFTVRTARDRTSRPHAPIRPFRTNGGIAFLSFTIRTDAR